MSLFTNWGSTPSERTKQFTCDNFVEGTKDAYFRAVDVEAPADLTYQWLCQMKVAPYSYDRLDNKGKKSPPYRTAGVDKLKLGDAMMTIFRVVHFIPKEEITVVMDVPPAKYAQWYVPTSITYKVVRKADTRSRIVVKYVAQWPMTFLGQSERLFIIVADFIMMRRQLLNFKALAERDYRERNYESSSHI